MDEEKIKESFKRIREDMEYFFKEIQDLKRTLEEIKESLITSTHNRENLDRKSRGYDTSTDTSTHILPLEGLKSPNTNISTGNQGVTTDRQTDRQTDETRLTEPLNLQRDKNSLQKASDIIDSLSETREEIRQVFGSLTKQEMLVLSTIYQLEEQHEEVTYPRLSQLLGITEGSVRDYVYKVLKKGDLLIKTKVNNKKVLISVSPALKKIASLSSIINFQDTS